MIAIIDFDIGNLAAISNMLHRIGARSTITSDPGIIAAADRLILPGNGAFDACMRNLISTGLLPLLEQRVLRDQTPLLGICVGAQMLGNCSEEGNHAGLGWLNFDVIRFPQSPGFPVPHMGWNDVEPVNSSPLIGSLPQGSRFYFVHSYYFSPADPADVVLRSDYGLQFAAAVGRRNIAGVQFHPEKSHRFGKTLLHNFALGTH